MSPSRIGAVAALLFLSLLAGCDEQALPQLQRTGEAAQRVAFVDVDRIARELGRDEIIRDRLQIARDEMTKELRQLANEVRAGFEEERRKLGADLDDAGRQQIERLGAEARQRVQEGQAALQRRTQELQVQLARELQDEIRPVVAEVARERGIAAVIPVNFLMWAETSTDITEAVIERLGEQSAPQ